MQAVHHAETVIPRAELHQNFIYGSFEMARSLHRRLPRIPSRTKTNTNAARSWMCNHRAMERAVRIHSHLLYVITMFTDLMTSPLGKS